MDAKPPIFSEAEETKLLEQYDSELKRMAYYYIGKRHVPRYLADDLFQEARIAFLLHIRRIACAEDVTLFYIYVKYALIRFMETTAVVRIPHNQFTKEIANFRRVSISAAEVIPVEYDDEMLSNACLDEFLKSLSCKERTMLEMLIDGFTNREIMNEVGINTDCTISRCMTKLKDQFRQYYSAREHA